jgi:hypothetical protein
VLHSCSRHAALWPLQSNGLEAEGGKALADGLKDNSAITELNIADNDLSGVIALANSAKDMGALSVLNLASNNLGEQRNAAEGWTKQRSRAKRQAVFTHADGAKQFGHPGKPEGIIAIANAIPDIGATTSLNLSSNYLSAEGAKIVAEAIKVTMCTPAIILASFSCPSDFSIN